MSTEPKTDEASPPDGASDAPSSTPPAAAAHDTPTNHDNNGNNTRKTRLRALLSKAAAFGRVEVRGITPIPVKERTVTRTVNVFTLWWSMNTNILG